MRGRFWQHECAGSARRICPLWASFSRSAAAPPPAAGKDHPLGFVAKPATKADGKPRGRAPAAPAQQNANAAAQLEAQQNARCAAEAQQEIPRSKRVPTWVLRHGAQARWTCLCGSARSLARRARCGRGVCTPWMCASRQSERAPGPPLFPGSATGALVCVVLGCSALVEMVCGRGRAGASGTACCCWRQECGEVCA